LASAARCDGRIVANPAAGVPVPDDGEEGLGELPLSGAEVAAIFDALPRASAIDLRNRCLLELLYGCGLRISEACALDCDDIDTVRRALVVREGKGGQDALLPVMGTALAATRDWLAVRRTMLKGPDHGALLRNQYGRRFDRGAAYGWFIDLNAARGPDARYLRPHLFRHSIAVHLLRGGADIRHVQEFLRHADLDTTKIYLRMVPGRLAEACHKAMPEVEAGIGSPSSIS